MASASAVPPSPSGHEETFLFDFDANVGDAVEENTLGGLIQTIGTPRTSNALNDSSTTTWHTAEQLRAYASKLRIGSKVKATWSTAGEPTTRWTHRGTVLNIGSDAIIEYEGLGRCPFPPTDPNVRIMEFVILPPHGMDGLPSTLTFYTIHDASRPPDAVIFADGACTVTTGASGAGIHVTKRATSDTAFSVEKHSKFFAASTNNVMEYIAFIGALNWVVKNPMRTLVILDSQVVIWRLFQTMMLIGL